jgi:hypothetical protein
MAISLKLAYLALSCENLRKIGYNPQEHNSLENQLLP